jgi:hypothetical protein
MTATAGDRSRSQPRVPLAIAKATRAPRPIIRDDHPPRLTVIDETAPLAQETLRSR